MSINQIITHDELRNQYTRHPVNPRFVVLSVATGLSVVVTLLSLWVTQIEIDLLRRMANPNDIVWEWEIDQSDAQVLGVAVLACLAYLGAAVCFCFWIHRITASLRALGAPIQYSPAWAVGWWFIPIANLWMPFMVMRNLLRCSMPSGPNPNWLILWWIFTLATSALDRVVMSMMLNLTAESSIEDWIRADRIYQWGDIVTVLWYLTSLALAWKMTSSVKERWREALAQPDMPIPDV